MLGRTTSDPSPNPRPRRIFSGLRARLGLLFLIALVPTAALQAATYLLDRRQAAADAYQEALGLANVVAAEQDRDILQTRQLLSVFAMHPDVRLRVSDWLARWGGEEFLVVAPETSLDQAAILAERLRGRLEAEIRNSLGVITGTFGVAAFRIGDTVDTLVQRADEALYRGKISGRNRVELGHLAA